MEFFRLLIMLRAALLMMILTIRAVQLGDCIAESFRYELRTSTGPYDLLVQSGRISMEQLDNAEERSKNDKTPISYNLRQMFEVSAEEIGESLSTYYQVPFHAFDDNLIIDKELIGNLNISFLASNHWVPLFNDSDKATILYTRTRMIMN